MSLVFPATSGITGCADTGSPIIAKFEVHLSEWVYLQWFLLSRTIWDAWRKADDWIGVICIIFQQGRTNRRIQYRIRYCWTAGVKDSVSGWVGSWGENRAFPPLLHPALFTLHAIRALIISPCHCEYWNYGRGKGWLWICVCERTENSSMVCGESFSRERTERVSLGAISLPHVDEPQNSGKVTMIFSLFSSNSRPILSTIFSSKACKGGRPHSTYMTRIQAPQFLCTPIT